MVSAPSIFLRSSFSIHKDDSLWLLLVCQKASFIISRFVRHLMVSGLELALGLLKSNSNHLFVLSPPSSVSPYRLWVKCIGFVLLSAFEERSDSKSSKKLNLTC